MFVAVPVAVSLLAACTPGIPGPAPTVTVTVTASAPPVSSLGRPQPGPAQISNKRSDGSFDAVPNFAYFGGPPCDTQRCNIAVYPSPTSPANTPLMNVDGHPIEGVLHHPGDTVHVVCQVITDKSVRDNRGHNSTVQDMIEIPTKFLTPEAKKRFGKGNYALGFTSDLWLGYSGFQTQCTPQQINTNAAS
jgi:hypothetical protein